MSLTHAKACARCNFPLEKAQIICPECGAVWLAPRADEAVQRAKVRVALIAGAVLLVMLTAVATSGLWFKPLLGVLPSLLAEIVAGASVPVTAIVIVGSVLCVLRGVRPSL